MRQPIYSRWAIRWLALAAAVDDARRRRKARRVRRDLPAAVAALRAELGDRSLVGRTVLDVPCGAGLGGLAALELGAARVISIDSDGVPLGIAHALRDVAGIGETRWRIELGTVRNTAYLASLGPIDMWVTHHGTDGHLLRVAPHQ